MIVLDFVTLTRCRTQWRNLDGVLYTFQIKRYSYLARFLKREFTRVTGRQGYSFNKNIKKK